MPCNTTTHFQAVQVTCCCRHLALLGPLQHVALEAALLSIVDRSLVFFQLFLACSAGSEKGCKAGLLTSPEATDHGDSKPLPRR